MVKLSVVLYSTGCPKCNVLKKKMDAQGIQYSEVNDIDEMQKLGMMTAPMLSVDGELMDFSKAVEWTNSQQAVYSKNEGASSFACDSCSI